MTQKNTTSNASHAGLSRREILRTTAAGFGTLALAGMLSDQAKAADKTKGHLSPKQPHFPAKAKRIIFLFLEGAFSQLDTWEYKPELQAKDGKAGPGGGTLVGSKFKFKQHGQTGTWVSELFPNCAKHVDKLCFVRGLHTDTPAHPQAVIQLHTGAAIASLTRPSMGAWLMYGLGTENQDLPGYVTINPPPNFGGAINYGSAFMPANYQGTKINDKGYLPNLQAASDPRLQRKQLDFIQGLNKDFGGLAGAPDELEGIIQSYELAFTMQGKVPEVLDFKNEPQEVLDAYGVQDGPAGSFARQCLWPES